MDFSSKYRVILDIFWLNYRKKSEYLLTNFLNIAYNIGAGRNALYTRETEFTFKCHIMAPVTGPPQGGFFRRKAYLSGREPAANFYHIALSLF